MSRRFESRRGSATILICVLLVPLLIMLAFAVDYGFLLYVKTDLQRTADQAALAAVRDLTPDYLGNQDLSAVRARVREYVQANLGNDFQVADSDIEIGRYNPDTIYTEVELLNDGILDTVRVTLRRNDLDNASVSLYFARLFDRDTSDVLARSTAVLQKARFIPPGAGVLPFAISTTAWHGFGPGEVAVIYGDGQLQDGSGGNIPGNWGTVDIGTLPNSTSDLGEQIIIGLRQTDLDALYDQGAIETTRYIDAAREITLNGDTGLSAGLRHPVNDVQGQMRVAPIYKKVYGKGGSLYFDVVAWAAVEVYDSRWNGSKNSAVMIRKGYLYDEYLMPNPDLSNTTNIIEAAYTSPVLVQ